MTGHSAPLDILCPMHCVLDAAGTLCHAGPTLEKLRSRMALVGRSFWDVFEVIRPQGITDLPTLLAHGGRGLRLRFRAPPETALKAVCAPASQPGQFVINLAFGIGLQDAVRDYALSHRDFAPTDLTTEMLYLLEAKSAAMDLSRRLNEQLQGDKIAAETRALTDPLTGAMNRRGLEAHLVRLIARGSAFVLVHADLDFFKAVNDTQGHHAGDAVLQRVAQIMRDETRDRDLVARFGGDEFVLVLEDLADTSRVLLLAERLIARISQPMKVQGNLCHVACSMGSVFSADYDAVRLPQMMKDADRALYQAKAAGRGRHVFANPARARQGAAPTGD
jgi:diguanylate cyclase (GGDEF)-like protein